MSTPVLEAVGDVDLEPVRPSRALPWLLVVGGGVGFVAAFTLLMEKIRLLEDPSYVPSCSINPVLSCGTVMKTHQAAVFGFPNPVMGIIGFTVVVVIGVVLLAGARLPAWLWLGLQAGVVFAAGLIGWLVFQSLYRINALCPYCMVVWTVTVPIVWYVTVRNLREGVLPVPQRVASAVADYHVLGLLLGYLVIIGLVAERFWDYWQTLLP